MHTAAADMGAAAQAHAASVGEVLYAEAEDEEATEGAGRIGGH
jgi:hypothetical protein